MLKKNKISLQEVLEKFEFIYILLFRFMGQFNTV